MDSHLNCSLIWIWNPKQRSKLRGQTRIVGFLFLEASGAKKLIFNTSTITRITSLYSAPICPILIDSLNCGMISQRQLPSPVTIPTNLERPTRWSPLHSESCWGRQCVPSMKLFFEMFVRGLKLICLCWGEIATHKYLDHTQAKVPQAGNTSKEISSLSVFQPIRQLSTEMYWDASNFLQGSSTPLNRRSCMPRGTCRPRCPRRARPAMAHGAIWEPCINGSTTVLRWYNQRTHCGHAECVWPCDRKRWSYSSMSRCNHECDGRHLEVRRLSRVM